MPPSDDTCAALEMLKGDREKGSSSGWPQQGRGQPLNHVGDLKTSSPMKDYWGDDHLRHDFELFIRLHSCLSHVLHIWKCGDEC